LVEDLYQPFHTRQTPSKKFIRFKWKYWLIPSFDIPRTAEQIAYYHYSFEKWTSDQFEKRSSPLQSALQVGLISDLQGVKLKEFILKEVVPFSSSRAHLVGSAAYKVFAPFNPKEGETAHQFVGTEEWQKSIQQKGRAMEEMISVSEELYVVMGSVSRGLIEEATSFIVVEK